MHGSGLTSCASGLTAGDSSYCGLTTGGSLTTSTGGSLTTSTGGSLTTGGSSSLTGSDGGSCFTTRSNSGGIVCFCKENNCRKYHLSLHIVN